MKKTISKKRLLIFIILLMIAFFKFIFLYFFIESIHARSADAEMYHEYAVGAYTNDMTLSWPIFLKLTNDAGLYSRHFFSFIILAISSIVIPLQAVNLSKTKNHKDSTYLFPLIITSTYPSLFYFSMDILRDIPMLFITLYGFSLIKKNFDSSYNLYPTLFLYIKIFFIGAILFKLRPYLAVAFFLSFFRILP